MSISLHQISKAYNGISAVQDISFEVKPAELFGIIGPDGAGKTTLFRILTTLLLADTGTAMVAGMDVVEDFIAIRKSVGYMPGRFSLYQDLTVEENLQFFATIFGTTLERNYELIKEIYEQIEPFKTRRAGKLSGGMKQKLALCCALIHKPKVLFLDEPTTGVDPVSRKEFWDMLKRLQAKRITILVSTPYMDEAALCDRVALMQDGHIMEIDSPKNIVQQYPKAVYEIGAVERHKLIQVLRYFPHLYSVYPFGEYVHYTDSRPDLDISELEEFLKAKGLTGIYIGLTEPTIEDVFMEMAKG